MPKAILVSYPKDYMDIILKACSKPYGNAVGPKGLENIIQSKHLSVLEHVSISFDVSSSQAVLGQFTRHRHHSFTCQSARGMEFDTFILPETLEEVPLDKTEIGRIYLNAIADGMPFEKARYYLPQGIKTSYLVSANARAWFEWLPKRLCNRAMPEHKLIAGQIYEQLKVAMPEIFDRIMMNCKDCTEKRCEFK